MNNDKLKPRVTGYNSKSKIPKDTLNNLNLGLEPSLTLSEILAVDMKLLLKTVYPNIFFANEELSTLGIVERIAKCSYFIQQYAQQNNINLEQEFKKLSKHTSDTARGWSCYLVPYLSINNINNSFELIKQLAADNHFGVREWAWLALREQVINNIEISIQYLIPWSQDKNPFIRRFSSEILRPRGVWCKHINIFKTNHNNILESIIPLLDNLIIDTDKYVQNSLANWLNDCAKDNSAWVLNLCNIWRTNFGTGHTSSYIIKRGLRNLKNL